MPLLDEPGPDKPQRETNLPALAVVTGLSYTKTPAMVV